METDFYDRLLLAKKYTDKIGSIYGTEDFCVYLYSTIKMLKPKTIVELGTGLGSTAIWTALALEENNSGIIHTIDDGSEWYRIKTAKDLIGSYYKEDYSDFINNLIMSFKLEKQINFINSKITDLELNNIDILFSDFAHSVFDVTKLLATYIPKMNCFSKIYIDSASTNYTTYHTLENIIGILNSGKIPKVFEEISNSSYSTLLEKTQKSKFSIEHIIENKPRKQNSTCCITISPVDIFPYPRINLVI